MMKSKIFNLTIVLFACLLSVSLLKAQELPEPTTLDLAWHPTENWLAVADTDGLRLIDMTNDIVLQTFPVAATPVYALGWSPDGMRLASGGADGTLEIWNSSGQLLANLVGHPDTVNALAWNNDGSRLASTSIDFGGNSLRTWDMINYAAIAERESGFITNLVWSHNGQQLFVSQRNAGGTFALDNQLIVSPLTYDIEPSLDFDGIAIDLHPTDNLIAAGGADGNIYIIDIDLNQLITTLAGHTDFITDVQWSSDGSMIISVSIDGTIKTWDATTGNLIDEFMQPNVLYAVALNPSQTEIAYGGENIGGANNLIPTIPAPQSTAYDEKFRAINRQ